MRPSSLSFGRVLNDVSSGTVSSPGCEPCVSIRPWQHEIHLLRDDEIAWIGVPSFPSSSQNSIEVELRDLGAWLDRRLVGITQEFIEKDFADIVLALFSEAVARENSMKLALNADPTGTTISRLIAQKDRRNVGEELRDLATIGIDFTFYQRQLIVFPREMPAPTAILTDEVLDQRAISTLGLTLATSATVLGATDSVEGRAGGISEVFGLVESVETAQSRVLDSAAATELAQQIVDRLEQPPKQLTARLLPEVPVAFDQLIPGNAFLVYATTQCETIEGVSMRLTNVDVNVTPEGESVDVTLVSV